MDSLRYQEIYNLVGSKEIRSPSIKNIVQLNHYSEDGIVPTLLFGPTNQRHNLLLENYLEQCDLPYSLNDFDGKILQLFDTLDRLPNWELVGAGSYHFSPDLNTHYFGGYGHSLDVGIDREHLEKHFFLNSDPRPSLVVHRP